MAKAIILIFTAILGLHLTVAQLSNLGNLLQGLGAGGTGGLPNVLNMGFFGNLGGALGGSSNGATNGDGTQSIQSFLLNQLGYTTTTAPPGPDCITNLLGFDPTGSLANLKSLLNNAVSQELYKCRTDPEVQNGTTTLVNQTAQKLIASLTSSSGGSLIDTFSNATVEIRI